jgi:hypothetical protein
MAGPGDETTRKTRPPDARELFRELRKTAHRAARVPAADRAELTAERDRLRARLSVAEWDDGFVEALREHLAHVGARLERLESLTSDSDTAGIEILELRGDLTWLALTLPTEAERETVAALQAEFSSLRPAAGDLARAGHPETERALDRADEELDRFLLHRLAERTALVVDRGDATVEDLWTAYLEAREYRAEGVREIRRDLRDRIRAAVEALAPLRAAEVLEEFAAEYEDRALDLLATQSELSSTAATELLMAGRREIAWLRGLLRDTLRRTGKDGAASAAARRTLERWTRRLGRANRRLERELQEVGLQARLDGIFGARFVAFFENLILWLIFAVVGILLVEVFLPPQHVGPDAPEAVREASAAWQPVFHVLNWTDFAICMVFLVEFFTKLALVRGRPRWFARHFLVDLVPSIPYGVIATHGLDALRAVRLARVARATRMIRYIRVVRPLARFVRFFGFLQRGIDRMVRQHGALLNRNVVLFEPETLGADVTDEAELVRRMRELRVLARQAWRGAAERAADGDRGELLASLATRLPDEARVRELPVEAVPPRPAGTKMVRAEDLVETLTRLDPGSVEATIGAPEAARIANTLSRLDMPLVRLFPGLRQMVRAARDGEPLQRVAEAGRALGRWVGRLLASVHWLSDLSGVITGPQFLDRLGGALVRATGRPARRLLIFGFAFLLLKATVHLFLALPAAPAVETASAPLAAEALADGTETEDPPDRHLFVRMVDWLQRTLGTTFLVLGFSCLVLLVVGMWFKRIAGEATDFYSRTAEAQYLNLMKTAKLANLDEDLDTLWQRVLRPERLILGEPTDAGSSVLRARYDETHLSMEGLTWNDKVLRLYHDYLDGALFNANDTKTTSQLLGNLSLENIRTERLGTSRRERKLLASLDLDRVRSAIRGPYFWFHSVNHSVAQWTAKLILAYNLRAIPLSERRSHPEAEVAEYEDWLSRRIEERPAEALEPEEEEGGVAAFRTTEFTALHFLTCDPMRDERVRQRFGERTLQALKADRRGMIRTIFGTYPFHRQPRADRTVNPFDLYERYVSGGKAILLPFYSLRLLFRQVWWFLMRVRAGVREVFSSRVTEHDLRRNWAGYGVAVRKINRMRKPLYMECARFRGLFDPEYLGLTLLAEEESGVEGRTWREDLDRIAARDEERDPFHAIREARAEALRELSETVAAAGGPERYVDDLRPGHGNGSWRCAYRALAIAWAIDYRSARTLATVRSRVDEILGEAIRLRGRVPGAGPVRRMLRRLVPSGGLDLAWREYRARFGAGSLTERELGWIRRALRANYRDLARLVRLAVGLEPGATPEDASRRILREVALLPDSWTEQLVTLRAVQSLSVLDIRNYRRQVWTLGGYEDESPGATAG